jgi:hypothetical protein
VYDNYPVRPRATERSEGGSEQPFGIHHLWVEACQNRSSAGWVEVHSRGDFHRYPGWTQLIDVVNDINGL